MKTRFAVIKDHFEKEAAHFDKLFFKVMPRYEEMMQALCAALPFKKNQRLNIADLGCGTGNLAQKLALIYPEAKFLCMDMAENMLKMARAKLKSSNMTFLLGDIRELKCAAKYDLIVASMVLHHIQANEKPLFYRKLYNALSGKGAFFCIDIFVSPDAHLQELYMQQWKAFMKARGLPENKIKDMIARHQKEDRPVTLTQELDIMRQAGFKHADVVLKHYNFALYGARRKS